jgi:Domain of unknown function (DUF4873)
MSGFAGDAQIVLGPDDGEDGVPVRVTLRGAFQPLDGRFHWWGRVAATDRLPEALSGREVVLRTPYGEGAGRLSDIDPWGRHRITGTGRPPFGVEEPVEEPSVT